LKPGSRAVPHQYFLGGLKMATMKGIWWTGPNEIKLRTDVPIPEVHPGEIKVKIA
jgi:hypothetical protein